MDSGQDSIFGHPSIKVLPSYNLYHSRTLKRTFTNDEFLDNVLVAFSLFVLVVLLKDIITRLVYMRRRHSAASNTITYFSQARIVLLDNSYFLRWVRKFRLSDAGHYEQRNHLQYNLVMLATLAMFIVEFGLVVPGLPANRLIYQDSDKMVRWQSEYLTEGRIVLLNDYPCIIAPVLDGPNLKSEASWTYCQYSLSTYTTHAKFAPDRLFLTVSNPDTLKGYIQIALHGQGILIQSKYTVNIPVHDGATAHVALSDNATTWLRNLQRNFDLLRDVTGLTSTLLPIRNANFFAFQVNASQVRLSEGQPARNAIFPANFWLRGMVQGILNCRAGANSSELYKVPGNTNGPNPLATPLKQRKLLIGAYVGTLVPAFFVVAFTAGTVLVYIAVCIFLKSPPGCAWELLQAHGRNHEDRILAGPPDYVTTIEAKTGSREENVLYNRY